MSPIPPLAASLHIGHLPGTAELSVLIIIDRTLWSRLHHRHMQFPSLRLLESLGWEATALPACLRNAATLCCPLMQHALCVCQLCLEHGHQDMHTSLYWLPAPPKQPP